MASPRSVAPPPGMRLVHSFGTGGSIIHRMEWSPCGRFLAAPARDGLIRIWSLEHRHVVDEVRCSGGSWVNAVAWSPNASAMVAGLEDGTIQVWTRHPWRLRGSARKHSARIECLHWSPDGKLIASASGDGTVRVWDSENLRSQRVLDDHRAWVNAVRWSPSGDVLATGAEDNTIRLWNADGSTQIATLAGHSDWIVDLDWAPDGKTLATVGDTSVRIWDVALGQLRFVLQGHADSVRSASFSHDMSMIASKSHDNTVIIWDTKSWQPLFHLPEGTTRRRYEPECIIRFNPNRPLLATLGENDTACRVWDVDASAAIPVESEAPFTHYTNAKIVLAGEPAAGKTCLAHAIAGHPFVPQASTHGMRVLQLPQERPATVGNYRLARELYVWDLAGQFDYHIVHQVFLENAAVGLIVFDASNPRHPFETAEYWANAFRRSASQFCTVLLVAAKIDTGPITVSQTKIGAFLAQRDIVAFIATSAATGAGIEQLRMAIDGAVPWDSLPVTSSPRLWAAIREIVIEFAESRRILITRQELFDVAVSRLGPSEDAPSQFDSVLRQVQDQGLVHRLSFGGYILLRPELLNDAASAIVLAAREHPDGLGCVSEIDVLSGAVLRQRLGEEVDDPHIQFLSRATLQLLVERDLAIRESGQLVFPSKVMRENHDITEPLRLAVQYEFPAPSEKVYAALVVRLYYSGAFTLRFCWTSGASFADALGATCQIERTASNAGRDRLEISFGDRTSDATKVLFVKLVHEHIHKQVPKEDVERSSIFTCASCGESVDNPRAINARRKRGATQIPCAFCDAAIDLVDVLHEHFAEPASIAAARNIESNIERARSLSISNTIREAKEAIGEHDVFLAYNSSDRQEVAAIAAQLRARGLNPWFDRERIAPGRAFQTALEEAIRLSKAAAIFIGAKGPAKWQQMEIRAFVSQRVERDLPVIPVLLPGVAEPPQELLFLREFTCVKFADGVEDESVIDELEWGITGQRPQRGHLS
ncbi:high-affnity carbon uptake protein Hat/HatR [alpha proteobacterium U9-1i]|nr:high-affnity carbon uptake protein Hat/HatR [alpha proteobacterium U9-1i]